MSKSIKNISHRHCYYLTDFQEVKEHIRISFLIKGNEIDSSTYRSYKKLSILEHSFPMITFSSDD